MVASGEGPRDHPALKGLNLPKLGWPLRTFVLVTKTLLFAAQEGPVGPERIVNGSLQADHTIREAKLRAYDKASGRELAEFDLPANATGSPMTYSVGRKQFVVLAVGGSNLPAELVAFSLNRTSR
jgi:quinoprotein glucose dehydrogenase